MSDSECSGGMGCLEVVIIVLVVLWFVGYWDKPKPPDAKEKPEAAIVE